MPLTGVVRPFELGIEASLILSVMKNWRSGKISIKFLMIKSYERSSTLFKLSKYCPVNSQRELPAFFNPRQVNLKIPNNSGQRQDGTVVPGR